MKDIKKPELIIPDTAPLIHLASVKKLDLLHEVGRVVLVDIVIHEATWDLRKPYAEDIAEWIKAGTDEGSNRPIKIEATEYGELYRAKKVIDPTYKMKGGGELAIIDWLAEKIEGSDEAAMVVYENGKVPRAIQRDIVDAHISVMTTRAFLDYLEYCNVIPSAGQLWQEMSDKIPNINVRSTKTQISRIYTTPDKEEK